VEAETLTLAKARLPARTVEAIARLFAQGAVNVWVPRPENHQNIRSLFLKYLGIRTLTLADASLLYLAGGSAVLATFDKNLASLYKGQTVGPGYWSQLPEKEKARIKRMIGIEGHQHA